MLGMVIRRDDKISTIPEWISPQLFTDFRIIVTDHALSTRDTNVNKKYKTQDLKTLEKFKKALGEFICEHFNCPNFRGVMRRHMQARMYSRPHKFSPVDCCKRFVKMISTNSRTSKGIIPDPEEKMIIIWFHMGKSCHFRGKWDQIGRNF